MGNLTTYVHTGVIDDTDMIVDAFRVVDPNVAAEKNDSGCWITVIDNEETRAVAERFDLEKS